MKLYAIKDIVANEFGPIFYAKNDNVALRMYEQAKSKNEFVAEEFKLFWLGSINDDVGICDVPKVPVEVNPVSILKKDEEVDE